MSRSGATFTGYQRKRETRWSVRFGEFYSRFLITFGGLGTIMAIVLVCVFLFWVAVPLFFGAKSRETYQYDTSWKQGKLKQIGVDPDQVMGWALFADGSLHGFRIDTGEEVIKLSPFSGQTLTAITAPSREDEIAVGFSDGSIRTGRIRVLAQLLEAKSIPPELMDLPAGGTQTHKQGIAHRSSSGALRWYQLKVEFDEPIKQVTPSPILQLDLSIRPNGPILAVLSADGMLRISEVTTRENHITGEKVKELVGGELKINPRGQQGLPQHLLITGVGDNVYLAWEDGHLVRINTGKPAKPVLAEELELTENGAKLTALQFMIGKATLLSGDSSGRVRAWFRSASSHLQLTQELPQRAAAVQAFAVSARSRVMATAYADGAVRLYYLTNQKHLADLKYPGSGPIEAMALAPKEDGLLAIGAKGIAAWSVDPGHPEVSYRSLIRPIWYEGYPGPAHVWQSSSGDDAFEPKFGLWPLIFGTLKATFYALLIGMPLALMAAVYTREFLHPRIRAIVKPTIEVMASLPSVVLGFLAALVIAPFVENIVPVVLTAFITIPTGFLLAGFLWHLLPGKWTRRIQGRRFVFIALVLPISILAAAWLAPVLERLLFAGNVRTWLDYNLEKPDPAAPEHRGSGGWTLLLLPISALAMAFLYAQFVNPWLRTFTRHLSGARESYINLVKFLIGFVCTWALAWLAGNLLSFFGFDPRTSFFGVYVQRNAMIVGFMMGFAIIPIIYTIAEDALTAVPDHLRSASLGCGATNWQTAARIIIPTAMSGLFSAVMAGLGRAVGETMVVLMAAGNTPVLEMNLFNGFRTLSANIAVELPEAVKDSTHYRTLFLAALVLFLITFVLNTLAEFMRQRFRKRAFEL